MLTIQFNTSNDAFDGNYTDEVSAILKGIYIHVRDNGPTHEKLPLRDSNGNTVGYWVEDGVA